MIHKVLGELYDTLLFFAGVLGMLIFFLLYWNHSFQIRFAEVILHEFLWKTAVTGKITKEDYYVLQRNLDSVSAEFELKLQCMEYTEQPVYSSVEKAALEEYFRERNKIRPVLFETYQLPLLQDTEELQLQTETNATVLSAVKQDYLSLPSEDTKPEIIALRPQQEVYEGEKLITVCKVAAPGVGYFVEAPDVYADSSGEKQLELTVNGTIYKVPVYVTCYPKTIQCDNGHIIINGKQIIEEKKQTGNVRCPYCRILPKKISCNFSDIKLKTGEDLAESGIGIEVLYMDGSTGYVTPEAKEWQDNYDKGFCGNQTVTIRYRNAETRLMVVSENDKCLDCGKECNDRSEEDYSEYPYCTDCLADMYLYTGQVNLQERICGEAELLSKLNTEQELLLSRGDFVMLELKKGKHRTVLQKKVTVDGVKRSNE